MCMRQGEQLQPHPAYRVPQALSLWLTVAPGQTSCLQQFVLCNFSLFLDTHILPFAGWSMFGVTGAPS